MKILKKIVLGLILSVAHAWGIAGSPGGLQLVIVGTAKAVPYSPALRAFFQRYNADSTDSDCDDSQLNIESVYERADKVGVTPALAIAAITDSKQRRKLGKLMTKYRDAKHERGFDGALAYDVKDDKILFYGISAMASAKIPASILPVADLSNNKKTALAICRALVHLPVLEAP